MSPRAGLELNSVIRAAAELADAEGLEQVTLASLAKRLGVRSPSLYNHVDGLPAVMSHLSVYSLRLLNEAVKAVAESEDGVQKMMAIAEAYLRFARRHPGLYPLTLRAPKKEDGEFAELGAELVNLLMTEFASLGLSEADGIHAARGFRSVLHGFASIEGHGGFGLPVQVDLSITFVLNAYLKGLMKD